MKIIKNNTLVKALSFILAVVLLSSCLKDKNDINNFSGVSTSPTVGIPEGGMSNFASNAVIFSSLEPDTVVFHVNYASENPPTSPVTVTIGFDTAALSSFNAGSTTKYEKLPDSTFSFTPGDVTINAGERMVNVPVVFYPEKIDPLKNYMFPISIKDAKGTAIQNNFTTIYLHTIGNPLSGLYSVKGTRTNYNGPVGGEVASVNDLTGTSPKLASPVDPETIVIDYANLGGSGWQYAITYDGTDISVEPNDVMASGIAAGSFKVYSITYDPAKKEIHVKTEYTNTAGNARLVEETFTHQ